MLRINIEQADLPFDMEIWLDDHRKITVSVNTVGIPSVEMPYPKVFGPMMIYVAAISAIAVPLFLLWNGRGSMDSERFKKRYPLSYELHQKAEQKRKELGIK